MELKLNHEYIISILGSSFLHISPTKFKVLEVTEKSYYLHDLDRDNCSRFLKEGFFEKNTLIEELEYVEPFSYKDLAQPRIK